MKYSYITDVKSRLEDAGLKLRLKHLPFIHKLCREGKSSKETAEAVINASKT